MESAKPPANELEITAVAAGTADHETPLLVLPLAEGWDVATGGAAALDEGLGGLLGRLLERGDFKGKENETQILYPPNGGGPQRVLLVGLGKRNRIDAERVRRVGGSAARQATRLGSERASIAADAGAFGDLAPEVVARSLAEGFHLGGYSFDELKSRSTPSDGSEPPVASKLNRVDLLIGEDGDDEPFDRGIRVGSTLARAENMARRLGNLPGNVATPTYLAEVAEGIGRSAGMTVTILGPAELEAEGMGALLAVSRGSDQEPRLIVLEHRKGPEGSAPLILVGKGLTFDSGGISIKPAQSMEEMKFDMCGGAAVLGAMQAIGELDLPVNVVGIVPSSENLLSGGALKPGDIIRSHLGKTIEVINTDAEGRLILADALSYARRFEPAAMIDVATLTGACVIALGHQASAVLGNDESLLAELREAGERTGERVWPLPMFDEYREQLKSDYADIKNSGGRPAGAITAAWFLRDFVGETPWAHFDIAGTAYGDGKLPYLSKGATGVPTRLLTEWVLSRVD